MFRLLATKFLSQKRSIDSSSGPDLEIPTSAPL